MCSSEKLIRSFFVGIGIACVCTTALASDYRPPRFADIENSPYENAQIVSLDKQTVMIIGRAGGLEPLRANASNVVLHRNGDTLHIVDSAALPQYREAILKAAEQLGSVEKVVMVNTHYHTDHTGNNDVIYDIPAREHYLLMSRLTLEYNHDQASRYASSTGRIQEFAALLSDRIKPNDSTREEWVRLLAPFEPMRPMMESTIPVESLPLERLQFGDEVRMGWKVTDSMYVIPTRGHTDDSIIVYFPENKLIAMGDETNGAYPMFIGGDVVNALNLFQDVIDMIDAGQLETLVDSHHYHIFSKEEAKQLMLHFIEEIEYEQRLYLSVLNTAGREGLRVDELIIELSKDERWNDRHKPDQKSTFPIALPMKVLKNMRDLGMEEVGSPPYSRFRLRHDIAGLAPSLQQDADGEGR